MGILMILAKMVYKKPDILTSMSFAIIITLIDNPFAIQDIGLQLSYLGTLGIVTLNKPILNFISRIIPYQISKGISVTIAAQILIIPIILLEFNTISFTFIISNILAVPIAGIIIIYGYINILLGAFSLEMARILSKILILLLNILIFIVTKTSRNSLFQYFTANTKYPIYHFILYYHNQFKKKTNS